jgi:hypothetical protein
MLLLHSGGWSASKADLAAVPVPDPTNSYHPVPYGRFVEEVELHVPRFGLTIERADFALARQGAQMFGVLTCRNGRPMEDWTLAIGLRNSYDRSLSIGLVARDLPDLIYQMLSQVASMRERIEGEIAAMKVRELPPAHAHHLMVEAIRANVIPASWLPKVIAAWDAPRQTEMAPRTAWSLFNAFTEVQKGGSARFQMDGSLELSTLFRRELHLA